MHGPLSIYFSTSIHNLSMSMSHDHRASCSHFFLLESYDDSLGPLWVWFTCHNIDECSVTCPTHAHGHINNYYLSLKKKNYYLNIYDCKNLDVLFISFNQN